MGTSTLATKEDGMRAILANPADDLPRLVYADWLDDRDRPERAEFIRVQCRIAEMDNSHRLDHEEEADRDCPCEWCALRRRERELWMGREWWALPTGIHVDFTAHIDQTRPTTPYNHAVYRRGFLDELTCDAESWLRVGDSLTWGWSECWCRYSKTGDYLSLKSCPACSGSGRVPPTMECKGECGKCKQGHVYTGMDGMKWIPCNARVPRPCPPTAQPITTVRLTTEPQLVSTEGGTGEWGKFRNLGPGQRDQFNCDRYPGITFHLPSQ